MDKYIKLKILRLTSHVKDLLNIRLVAKMVMDDPEIRARVEKVKQEYMIQRRIRVNILSRNTAEPFYVASPVDTFMFYPLVETVRVNPNHTKYRLQSDYVYLHLLRDETTGEVYTVYEQIRKQMKQSCLAVIDSAYMGGNGYGNTLVIGATQIQPGSISSNDLNKTDSLINMAKELKQNE